jgi:hypothetical protein
VAKSLLTWSRLKSCGWVGFSQLGHGPARCKEEMAQVAVQLGLFLYVFNLRVYILFLYTYLRYTICIKFFGKNMGIQLNTHEYTWARP